MKKIFYLALFALALGCESEKVEEEEKSEVASYLLTKSGLFGNNLGTKDTIWTYYTYTPKGLLVDPQETIFPENVGSLDKPFAQNQKSRRIYVDQNYRVTRRDEGGNEYRYSYNEDGTIKRVLEYIPMFNVENVKDYKYYKTGELHMAGPAYTITESEMSYNPSTGRMDIFPGKITKHLFDGTRPVKSWHTRPYNYGKRESMY